jgi:xylulokinase
VEDIMGHPVRLPRVLGPSQSPGDAGGVVLGPGTGDNMAAGLGVGAGPGDVVVSIGTSGTVFASSEVPTADATGIIAGFADALGGYLPLVCTLNASRVLDAMGAVLGVDYAEFDALALSVPDAGGLVFLPYLEGERTPNLPDATASLHGVTRANSTPARFARAAVEGMICGLAAGLTALQDAGVACRRVLLVGGGAQSTAVATDRRGGVRAARRRARAGEYVAAGAARQAAWTLTGELPQWDSGGRAQSRLGQAVDPAAVHGCSTGGPSPLAHRG